MNRFEISTSAKHWSLLTLGVCGQYGDPNIVIGFDLVDCRFKATSNVTIDRISCVRAIKSDYGNFALNLIFNDICHIAIVED
jgi:hypothetical protein